MNSVSKEQLVKSLCKLSANLCSYIKKPCDCKFIQSEIEHGSENGSGCPETMIAALLLANMTEQEFLIIASRANITINDEDAKIVDVLDIINEFQKKRFDKSIITKKSKTTKGVK